MTKFRNLPLFVILMGITSASMIIPVLFAARLEQWMYARTFFYHSVVLSILTLFIAIAIANNPLTNKSASRLLDLLGAFIVMPIFMAMPVQALLPQYGMFPIYFEMLSSFTTTGASIFNQPENIPDVIHFWRGYISWIGGFMMLVVAIAIFMPINLGGFEVYSSASGKIAVAGSGRRAAVRDRMVKYSLQIFPLYFTATAILTLILLLSGDRILVAVIHAMSVMSTSSVSPIGGVQYAGSGFVGEVAIFFFLFLAISRHWFLSLGEHGLKSLVLSDRELNLSLTIILIIPLLLFLRHWLAAADVAAADDAAQAGSALWGALFTCLSFLTTTGFESGSWAASQNWSGLGTSGLILMGLAVMGGGIATTAGGMKLLRVYSLYKHGIREMQRLSYPSSVGGSGTRARSLRREGAYAAWVFFMLFLVSIAVGLILLSATGIAFEDALILAISGLSNTGNLLGVASDNDLKYSDLSNAARGVLCALMILGRMEALAVIAIFNPSFWRK